MELTNQEIEKIARLARISLDETEEKKFGKQLSEILGYFQKMQDLDTSEVDLNLTETETTNQTRADKNYPDKNQEKILANAPVSEERFIKVKSVL